MLIFDDVFFQEHQKQMLKSLPSFAKALFCFYGVLALLHPFFVPAPYQWIMSFVSGGSAVIFILISLYVKRKNKNITEFNIIATIALMASLAMINTFLHFIVTKNLLHTTNILFICFALSAVGFKARSFFYIIIAVNITWLSIIIWLDLYEDPTFIHFTFTMIITAFVSTLMAATRYKLLSFSVMEIMRRKEAESKLKAANSKLKQRANIDTLTGLANRRYYNAFFKETWKEMKRLKQPMSLIIADIDHFKQFNDRYGHHVGDDVLLTVAKTLNRSVRASTDLVARYGGEEFVAIIPNISEANLLIIAEKMRQQVSELKLKTNNISISLGVATLYPDDSSELQSLFYKADAALYQAKKQGRNRVHKAN